MIENKQKVLTFPTPSKNDLAQKLSRVTMWLCLHLTGETRSWRPLLNTSFGLLNYRKITNKLKKSVEGQPERTGSGALALWGEPVEKTPLGGPDRCSWCWHVLKRWTKVFMAVHANFWHSMNLSGIFSTIQHVRLACTPKSLCVEGLLMIISGK